MTSQTVPIHDGKFQAFAAPLGGALRKLKRIASGFGAAFVIARQCETELDLYGHLDEERLERLKGRVLSQL